MRATASFVRLTIWLPVNRAGKTLITLPENAHVMPPLVIEDEHDMLLAITQAGRMLMFPVDSLPQLSKRQRE
ncbi:DNA topoisomerase 4 subunit A [Salmonella sp. NCTC 11881]|nr:DNA topoisomerase 4 subunit A [Salmonella sp. NCTC 11881]